MGSKLKLSDIFYSKIYIFAVSLFVLLNTCYLGTLPSLNKYVPIITYIICIMNFMLFILNFKFNKFSISMVLFSLFLFFATMLASYPSYDTLFINYFPIVSYSLYLELCLKKDSKKTISILNIILFSLITINFITIVLYPNGMYSTFRYDNNWFFKYDNTHIFMYLPGMLTSYLACKCSSSKLTKVLFIIEFFIISYCILYCNSATSVVGYFTILIYIIFWKQVNKISLINSKSHFILLIAIFFGIVIFNFQDLFKFLIVDVLHKNLTFTGRTFIWSETINLILRKPLLGYGISKSVNLVTLLGNSNYTHAHNTFLDVLFKGGILTLIPFIGMIISAVKENYIYKENRYAKFISIFLLSVFVMINFEARQEKIGFFIILILAYNTKEIIKHIEMKGK